MGGASSKASRSLPKGAASSAVPRAGGSGSAGSGASSRPTPTRATPQDRGRQSSPLDTAEAIGQTGRQASPLDIGQGSKQVDDGHVGPVVERSQGGSETKDDREWRGGEARRGILLSQILTFLSRIAQPGIRRDAFDPDFVTQLNNLGPVNIPPAPWQSPASQAQPQQQSSQSQQPVRRPSPPSSSMTRILQARQEREAREENERQASTQTTDTKHLDAPTLTALLDELKAAKSTADVEKIATSYDFDRDTLRDLARRFNSPSVGEPVDPEEARYQEDRDSDRPPRIYAVWKDFGVRV